MSLREWDCCAPRGSLRRLALRAATLRSAHPPLLFPEPDRRAERNAHARARRGGAGRAAGSRHRPLPPRPAPSGHCRISIVPRHNFAADPARSRRARRRKYSPCRRSAGAGGSGARAGGLRGAPGAGGPCAGRRRQPGHPAAQLSGSRKSWAPARLSSLSSASFPIGAAGGDSCLPVPGTPDPSSPGLVPAELHNFLRAAAKVSAKCRPSCSDGTAKPVRGARGGTRAPPGKWSGSLGQGAVVAWGVEAGGTRAPYLTLSRRGARSGPLPEACPGAGVEPLGLPLSLASVRSSTVCRSRARGTPAWRLLCHCPVCTTRAPGKGTLLELPREQGAWTGQLLASCSGPGTDPHC